ncbi:MAG: SsrA-binding protein SmpB [Anaerolineae bacterium]|nr:SsrA-binding protein SmpB [Anaerolineae bacterium]
MAEDGIKVIARNRKARHDYEIIDTLEAGLVLMGSEIKSIRASHINLSEGFVQFRDGEMWLHNVHINPYEQANRFGHEPLRPRKLLLHKREIARWASLVQEKRLAIVPLQVHLRRGRAKLEIALARGKKKYDKRETLRKEDAQRQIERALKDYS